MQTPRSTQLAERLIIALCLASSTWFIGYEVGRWQEKRATPPCIAPAARTLDWSKFSLREKKMYAEHWRQRGGI
jgi:hypothetical protein